MVTSRDYITDILEICLERLRSGDSIAACLHDYPHCAEELAPLLSSADYARRAPHPQLNPAARKVIQRQLHRAVAGRAPRRTAASSWYRAPVLRFSALLLAIVLAIGGGTVGVAAAQSSLPGSPLYSVKRAGERLRLTLTTRPDKRAILHMELAQERLAETLALLDSQQSPDQRVLDDLAHEYELAWANIQLLPPGEAQAQRQQLIAESQVDLAALSEALKRVPNSDRPALEAALRSNQATLLQAIEQDRASHPKAPTGDQTPKPGQPAPPESNQDGRPAPANSPPAVPARGQDQGTGNSQGQPADPGNGQGNGQGNSGEHVNPDPGNQPQNGGNSGQNGGNSGQNGGNGQVPGQGQPADPGNRQGDGPGNSKNNGGNNSGGKGQDNSKSDAPKQRMP